MDRSPTAGLIAAIGIGLAPAAIFLVVLAATGAAHFRSAHGSCVIDAYTTSLTTYEEIACLVSGPGSSNVLVAAAPARLWQERSAVLERAVLSFWS